MLPRSNYGTCCCWEFSALPHTVVQEFNLTVMEHHNLATGSATVNDQCVRLWLLEFCATRVGVFGADKFSRQSQIDPKSQ